MQTFLAALLLATGAVQAETADEVIDRARDANEVDSSIQTVKMVLVSKGGSERVRELEIRTKRDGEIVKSLARFTSPSDVAGTQLLLVDNPGQIDEQLFYLPALKRTNRISGKARKGSFMGSDFAYEDFETADSTTATHSMVSEVGDTWMIDTDPGDDSQYGRLRVHITKADLIARTVEFYDDDDELLKTLVVEATTKDGDVTLPTRSVMTHTKGTKTRLEIAASRLNVSDEELPDETFTKAYMER